MEKQWTPVHFLGKPTDKNNIISHSSQKIHSHFQLTDLLKIRHFGTGFLSIDVPWKIIKG